jgi:hypothetical protein
MNTGGPPSGLNLPPQEALPIPQDMDSEAPTERHLERGLLEPPHILKSEFHIAYFYTSHSQKTYNITVC